MEQPGLFVVGANDIRVHMTTFVCEHVDLVLCAAMSAASLDVTRIVADLVHAFQGHDHTRWLQHFAK